MTRRSVAAPCADYYAVDLLARGSNVEVYKNIEGWCAIRPPEGSFSWVPARHLRLGGTGKVAEVTEPKAVAWIGSNLARPKEHMYQVKLERGETVAISGETRFERKKEQITETWYKIEPPAGEFRWIESRFLSKPKSLRSELVEKSRALRSLLRERQNLQVPNHWPILRHGFQSHLSAKRRPHQLRHCRYPMMNRCKNPCAFQQTQHVSLRL